MDAPEIGHICDGKSLPYDFGWTATTGLMDLTAGVAQVMCYPKDRSAMVLSLQNFKTHKVLIC